MDDLGNVLSLVLAAILVGSAVGKLTRAAPVVENLSRAGVQDSLYRPLALLELAAAAGLVLGLWWAPVRLAAAVGVVLYFVGALVFHARARDPQVGPPAFLGLLAAAVVVTVLA